MKKNETVDDINILQVSGPISELSEEEQKLKVIETMEKNLKRTLMSLK